MFVISFSGWNGPFIKAEAWKDRHRLTKFCFALTLSSAFCDSFWLWWTNWKFGLENWQATILTWCARLMRALNALNGGGGCRTERYDIWTEKWGSIGRKVETSRWPYGNQMMLCQHQILDQIEQQQKRAIKGRWSQSISGINRLSFASPTLAD